MRMRKAVCSDAQGILCIITALWLSERLIWTGVIGGADARLTHGRLGCTISYMSDGNCVLSSVVDGQVNESCNHGSPASVEGQADCPINLA